MIFHGQRGAWYTRERQHVLSECDFITPNDPDEEDGGEGVETHEGGIDGPFALDDTRVQDHESRHRLQADDGRSGHLPGIIARVKPIWCRHGV